MENKGSYSWWWDSHNSPQHSQWLQSILSDLNQKTKAMLTLIQEDGDSFTQQNAYYEKKPDLVKMVEEFHRSYCSLAELYDQLKSESALVSDSCSSSSSNSLKQLLSLHNTSKKAKGSGIDFKFKSPDSNPESVLEDPDLECNTFILPSDLPIKTKDGLRKGQPPNLNLIDGHQSQNSGKLNLETDENSIETEVVHQKSNGFELGHETVKNYGMANFLERDSMWSDLRLQVSRLMEENLKQQAELIRRNDEKRETIKELCTRLETLMEENRTLQKCVRVSKVYNKQNSSQILRFNGLFKFLRGGSA